MMADRQWERRYAAETIFAKGAVVADKVGRNLSTASGGRDHGLNEVVIGVALIREALAVGGYCDNTRLRSIDEVRHDPLCPVLTGRHGHRHPGRSMREGGVDFATDSFSKPQP